MHLSASAHKTLHEPNKPKASPNRASLKRAKAKCTTVHHLKAIQSTSRTQTDIGANRGGTAGKAGDDRRLRDLCAVKCTNVLQADSERESQFTSGVPTALCTALMVRVPEVGVL